MRRFCQLLAVTAFISVVATNVFAQETPMDKAVENNLGNHAKFRQVITDLQKAIRTHDASGLAGLVEYPIDVTINGKKTTIADAKSFVAKYDDIVTPAIAAAVQDENYEDMMSNYKGVMLGQGEVWVNALCRDNACKSVDVKVITIQTRSDLSPPLSPEQLAAASQVQPLKRFKNWIVGCDNLHGCLALGTISDTERDAYIKISRGGAATDEAAVSIAVDAGSEIKTPTAKLVLDGAEIPAASYKVTADGEYISVALAGGPAADLAGKLRNSKSLNISVLDGAKTAAEQEIPLNGSAAALLYLDDTQKRVGTETALSGTGDKPASSIPALPILPSIKAQKLSEIDGAKPPFPHGVTRPKNANCDISDDMLIKLSPKLTLWGVCTQMAAYNFIYEFWTIGDGKPKRVNFNLPGRKPDPATGTLVSPSLSKDGFVLNAFSKGEGLGDCGNSADWVWDGETFKLLNYSEMTVCRGITSDDWPVLYRAQWQ